MLGTVSGFWSILKVLANEYMSTDDKRLVLLDCYSVYLIIVSGIQFVYMGLFGSFPFNSFLSGLLTSVGSFALTISLRLQLNKSNFGELKRIPERAFLDWVIAHVLLFLVAVNFLGVEFSEYHQNMSKLEELNKMNPNHFIAKVKLAKFSELHEQRTKLYEDILEEVSKCDKPDNMFQVLLKRLNEAEIRDVKSLRHFIDSKERFVSSDIIDSWNQNMIDIIHSKQKANDLSYVFGSILEDWSRTSSVDEEECDEAKNSLLDYKKIISSKLEPLDLSFLDEIYEANKEALDSFGDELNKEMRIRQFKEKVKEGEVSAVIGSLSKDIYLRRSQRELFASAKKDAKLLKEISDVCSLLLLDLDEWSWEESVGLFPLRTRSKWRCFWTPHMMNRIFTEVMGRRVGSIFKELMVRFHPIPWRRNLLSKGTSCINSLRTMNHSEVYASAVPSRHELTSSTYDPYSTSVPVNTDDKYAKVVSHTLNEIKYFNLLKDIGVSERLFVIKTDIAQYFPGVRHELIKRILEILRVDPKIISFIMKFLKPEVTIGEETFIPNCGIPMDFFLSKFLAELLHFFFDLFVVGELKYPTRSQFLRQVDDQISILWSEEDAVTMWKSYQEILKKSGLSLNLKKCGAVEIGGEGKLPVGLPETLPTFSFLVLRRNGTWGIDQNSVDIVKKHFAERIRESSALIKKVDVYNSFVRYVMRMLCTTIKWADDMPSIVSSCILDLHENLLDDGEGIEKHLLDECTNRFHVNVKIPSSWLYFPITAGGLGLVSPYADLAQMREYEDTRGKPATPEEEPEEDDFENKYIPAMFSYYNFFRNNVAGKKGPEKTPLFNQLEADFVKRGKEVYGKSSSFSSLSSYWQWVLYLHGPALRKFAGNFRFVDTEVIPQSLISQIRMDNPF